MGDMKEYHGRQASFVSNVLTLHAAIRFEIGKLFRAPKNIWTKFDRFGGTFTAIGKV